MLELLRSLIQITSFSSILRYVLPVQYVSVSAYIMLNILLCWNPSRNVVIRKLIINRSVYNSE